MIVENYQPILYRWPHRVSIFGFHCMWREWICLCLISLYLDFIVFPFSLHGCLSLLAAPVCQGYTISNHFKFTFWNPFSSVYYYPIIIWYQTTSLKKSSQIKLLIVKLNRYAVLTVIGNLKTGFYFFLSDVWLDLEPTRPSQFVASKAILSREMVTVSPSFSLSPPSPAAISFFHSQHYQLLLLLSSLSLPTRCPLSQSPCSEQVYLSLFWWVYYSEVSP